MAYDVDADYNKKSIHELQDIRVQFEEAVEKYGDRVKMFNEHLQYVKMKIAERIGKRIDFK